MRVSHGRCTSSACQGNKGAIFTGFGKRTTAVRHASPRWVNWHKALPYRLMRCGPLGSPRLRTNHRRSREQPPLSIYKSEQPNCLVAAQTRKPGGQCLKACLPGLTADTTVFAIGRHAEIKVHMARRQEIASKGCHGSGVYCTLALSALGGRFRFVWRCLKLTGT
jgi:hypothetical protein